MSIIKYIVAVILLLTMPNAVQAAQADYRIYTAAGEETTVEAMAGLIQQYDVLVFGEYHDNAVLHALELELLQRTFAHQPGLAVSLEMFERDVQGHLDDYLAGQITEQEFLAKSRPWNNYQEAYRPLVAFAGVNSLPVIAANIPRTLAAQYAKTGSLTQIAPEMTGYLPQLHLTPDGEYRERFFAQMTEMGKTGTMPVSPDKLENYYRAQCLKDDTMAESIANYRQAHPEYKIIHYQGDFHSKWRLGVVEKLQLLQPDLRIAVITPVYLEDSADIPDLLKQHQQAGDWIVFVRRQS